MWALWLLLSFFIIVYLASAVLIMLATIMIGEEKAEHGNNHDLAGAYYYGLIATLCAWIPMGVVLIGFIIILLISGFTVVLFIKNQMDKHGTAIVITLTCIFALAIMLTGILSVLAAIDLRKSAFYSNDGRLRNAYVYCCSTAVLCIASVGLVLFGMIGYIVYSEKKKRERKEKEKLVEMAELQALSGNKGEQPSPL